MVTPTLHRRRRNCELDAATRSTNKARSMGGISGGAAISMVIKTFVYSLQKKRSKSRQRSTFDTNTNKNNSRMESDRIQSAINASVSSLLILYCLINTMIKLNIDVAWSVCRR
jgi:hypothetical protein